MAGISTTLFCLLASAFTLPAVAQNPPLWRFWNAGDGFAESFAGNVTADSAGRIWANHGTVGTMSRLDGYSVESLHYAYNHSRLFAGPGGELWLFDGAGLRRYNGSNWSPFRFPDLLRFPQFHMGPEENWVLGDSDGEDTFRLALSPLGAGRVLVLLPDRLLDFDMAGPTTTIKIAARTMLKKFADMRRGHGGTIWLTGERGVACLRRQPGNGSFEWREYPAPEGFDHIEYPFEGEGGELFVSASAASGRVVLRLDDGHWEKVFSGHTGTAKGWRGADHDLWIQDGNTILRASGSVLEPVERVETLSGLIYDLLPLPGGAFWVATTQGLARHAPPLWRTPPALRDRDMDALVNSIVEDSRGRLWFLTPRFLSCFTNGVWARYPLPPKYKLPQSRIDNIYLLPDGSLGLASSGKNLIWIFDPNQKIFTPFLHPDGRQIRMFAQRKQGGIFVQTFAPGNESGYRLESFDGRSFRVSLDRGNTWGISDLRAVLETSDGALWFGGDTGLAVFKNGAYRKLTARDGYPDSGAFSLFEPSSGRLLVGGRDMLVEFDGQRWTIIQTGLDRVRSILRGRDGTLWLASGSGVHRYLHDAWITNAIPDGLTSNAAYKIFEDSQGRIWAGTTRGISLFHPDADTDPPHTRMAEDGNLRETAPDGEVHLVFQGVDRRKYTLPERLLFSHRVDGGGWSRFRSSNAVTLRGMATGRHRFEVRAMDRNGNIDPQSAGFDFTVLIPWYRSPGFLVILVLGFGIIAVLLFLAVRHYLHRGALIRELRHAHLAAETARESAEEARQLAEASNRAKGLFLANMSHEIRTPMNGILGMTELTLDTPVTPEQRENLETVKECADSLLTILNDILDFSRIDAGKIEFDRTDFCLRAALAATLKPLVLRAAWKGIKLECQVADDVPDSLVGDPVRLRQVILNLAGNAVKFTEMGLVVIYVVAERAAEREITLRFSICDTGAGIPPEKQQIIFQPFEQGDGSITRKFGGTGLGLAISAKLVQMMQGRIWLESPWRDRPEPRTSPGSAFHCTVTFGISPPADLAPISENAAGPAKVAAQPALPPSTGHRGLRILVAEDNPVNQKVVAGLLQKCGYSPVLVADGREAITALAGDTFDLVLMDIHMPNMDGFEATAAIRRLEAETGNGNYIPIIAVTAHAMKGDDARCREAGMNAYISKPIKAAELLDAIRRLSESPSALISKVNEEALRKI